MKGKSRDQKSEVRGQASEAVTIRVRETGSDNYARVLGKGITASCTSSPAGAAARAAKKYFGKREFSLQTTKEGSCVGRVPSEYVAHLVLVPVGARVDDFGGRSCGYDMKTNTLIPNTGAAVRLIPDQPTDAERDEALGAFFAQMGANMAKGRSAVAAAVPALGRLIDVMRNRTGQSYKIRDLLYSLYNGQDTSLLEIVTLDRAVREDLCAVLLAFGFEERGGASFFYKEMKAAIEGGGIWKWFIDAHKESGVGA